jgi:hypothetical protein
MTASTDFDRVVASWLEASGPIDPPPALLERGIADARRVQQRRGFAATLAGPRPWPPTRVARLRHVPVPMRIALLAVLLLAALGAAGLAGSWLDEQSLPAPSVVPSVAPSAVEPPAASVPVSPAAGAGAPEGVRGTWSGANTGVPELNAADPTVSLLIDLEGTKAWVAALGLGQVGSLRWASSVDTPAPGELRLTSIQDGHGCRTGDEGRYRMALSADGGTLTLEAISDACAARAAALAQAWTRTLGGPNLGGRGIVDQFDPPFIVTLPAGSYTATLFWGGVELRHPLDKDDLAPRLTAIRDPQVFTDPCRFMSRTPIAPGIGAFVQHFRETPGWSVVSVDDHAVGGRRAVRIVLEASADATCVDGLLHLAIPTPEASKAIFGAAGHRTAVYVAEVGDATVLFRVDSPDPAMEQAVIDSIEFPEASPRP